MDIAANLREMHALAADSCDPEYNKALLDAADEIDRLRAALNEVAEIALGSDLSPEYAIRVKQLRMVPSNPKHEK